MTEIAVKGGISGPKMSELKKILKLLTEIDEQLKKHDLRITSSIIYTKDNKTKIRLDITEAK